uniref:Uncharacterized protein n=1 Tax=Arundo donax TaxID=35708 RepID=A0A0A8YMX5_ARUDO
MLITSHHNHGEQGFWLSSKKCIVLS